VSAPAPAGLTIAAALCWARQRLEAAEIDSPALDAEVLLAHALGSERAVILAHPERTLTPAGAAQFRDLVERRAGREPLAYIIGHKEFYGLDFWVDRRVLVPRPETELLVERAVAWARARRPAGGLTIADVGTGSGAIAVAIAVTLGCQSRPPGDVRIYALDCSLGALEVARRNAERHGVSDCVRLLAGDLLAPLPEPADLIVANLPYVAADELARLMPEVSRHEPRQALDGGPDGLELVRRLLLEARSRLRAGAALMLEIGAQQGEAALAAALAAYPDAACAIERDLAGRERLLVVQTPVAGSALASDGAQGM
jgi:release factor glutamine methyltransferase